MNAPVSFAESKLPLLLGVLFVIGLIAPFAVYPTFLMKILCYALFACAFNLLLGFAGLLSFGHAAYFAIGAFATVHGMNAVERGVPLPTPLVPLGGAGAGFLAFEVGHFFLQRVKLGLAFAIQFVSR